MRAVWSFWTKPFKANHSARWVSELHHLFAWVLSVETARKHYPKTSLFTDDEGARMLIDGIGLEIDYVSTELNALHGHDPGWWAFGKIYAYRAQEEPFVHIDNDAFLWNPLPEQVACAPVFAQNPYACYKHPEAFESVIRRAGQGWLPEEWSWYRLQRSGQKGESCGILGGNQVEFIHYYAGLAINLIEHPHNQIAWSLLSDKINDNVLFEEYLLAACIEYHRGRECSRYKDVSIQHLFASFDEAFAPSQAERVGYTHLIGGGKSNRKIADRLEKRIMRDYPVFYDRCIKYVRKSGFL